MTSPEILRSELDAFAARRDAKFAEICSALREQHGIGESEPNDDRSAEIIAEAQDCIETWQVKRTGLSETAVPNPTPLQRLLTEYCEIETEIAKREDALAALEDALDDDDNDD